MKVDRLIAIITILLQRQSVTAPELAERLEVTRRTIGRDLDDLCRAGIPIVTRQGAGGGISIAEGYRIDKSLLTRDELEHILIGLKGLASVEVGHNTGLLLDKLAGNRESIVSWKDSIVIDLSSHYRDSLSEKIKLFQDAIRDHRVVAFDYYSEKGMKRRRIEPCFVVFKWAAWYVSGFCQSKQCTRLFKLNRLWNMNLEEEVFIPQSIPKENVELDAFLTDENIMKVVFDSCVEYLLVENYGPDSYTQQKDGRLLLERGYTNQDFALQWILGFGMHAEVLEPKELRDEVYLHIIKLLQKYQK